VNDHCEYVFRHAGGCLIDSPDLPVTTTPQWPWTATVWPDATRPDGWASLIWQPGERGWRLPTTLALGDVIEFGTTAHDQYGRPIPVHTHRWYGWLHYATDYAVVITGPYRHPRHAYEDARALIDLIRLDQLDVRPDLDNRDPWLDRDRVR
jgi:hypothetical protein